MSTKANCTTQVLITAVTALLAGIGLGMLFAPEPGKETRRKILSTAGNLGKGVNRGHDFPDTEMEMDAINGDLFSR
jgi:hypothetical protein